MLKFSWHIENFSLLNQDTGEYMCSPHFKIKFMKNVDVYLRLYPRGRISPTRVTCVLSLSDDSLSLDGGTFVKLTFTNEMFSRVQEHVASENNKSDLRLTIKREDFDQIRMQPLYEDSVIIECVIHKEIHDLTLSPEILSAKTVVQFEKHTHNLLISPTLVTRPNSWLRNLQFSKNIALQQQSGRLKLCIDFGNDSEKTQSNCLIEIARDSVPAMVLQCKLLLYSKENTFHLVRGELFLKEPIGFRKWNFDINENDVTNFSFMCCDLKISNGKVISKTGNDSSLPQRQTSIPRATACPEYNVILKNMFENKKFCDVVFQVGSEQFPAHKCVLAAVSDVFATMFIQNMEDTKPIIVPILDMDSDTIAKILLFVYKETVENLQLEELTKLYSASEKYQILNLKNICTSQLMTKLCMDNVCEILEIANLHQDKSLEDFARNFIYSNYRDIYGTNSWKSLMDRRIHLAADIMLQVCLRS